MRRGYQSMVVVQNGGGASAPSGTATAANVLAGQTFDSEAAGTGATGTMPDRGGMSFTPGTTSQVIPEGYHNGTGAVGGDGNLLENNIRLNTVIFGVTGTLAPDVPPSGTAVAADVLATKTFESAAIPGASTGTMVNRGAIIITPDAFAHTIPAGYHNGAGAVPATAGLSAPNVKSGAVVGGVTGTFGNGMTAAAGDMLAGKTAIVGSATITGTMPNRTTAAATQFDGTTVAGRLYQMPPIGYYNGGTYIYADDPNFIASNIRSGFSVFGLTGNLVPGLAKATGTMTALVSGQYQYISVSGLAFTPQYVFASLKNYKAAAGADADNVIAWIGPNDMAGGALWAGGGEWINGGYIHTIQITSGTGVFNYRVFAGGFQLNHFYSGNLGTIGAQPVNWMALG